jgi:hypothetical protein
MPSAMPFFFLSFAPFVNGSRSIRGIESIHIIFEVLLKAKELNLKTLVIKYVEVLDITFSIHQGASCIKIKKTNNNDTG